ncbi:histidine kinase [Proteobacteria bacterium 005FR1]|nr:histidine kinase [Proteobacteria bacterium 005FR1]
MSASNPGGQSPATAEVLSKVAHDLRNPLNSISMNAELVKLKLQRSGDPEQVVAYLDRILQECRNCGAVLESSTGKSEQQ